MNLYLAALYHNMNGVRLLRLNENEQWHQDRIQYVLESYHYMNDKDAQKIRDENKKHIFVDSGAFSAFTLGATIDIKDYCKFLHKHKDVVRIEDGVFMASVLDGIGDPLKTYQNQLAMEQLGIRPLPCFHYGEDERYLEHYVANYPYVTLGGMVMQSSVQLIYWLDRIWERYLVDGSGKPRLKVHGFGLTSPELMARYPWHSVDSSSWVQIGSFGAIYIPGHGMLHVSEHSPSRKVPGQHVDNLPSPQRDFVLDLIKSQGFDLERLRTSYVSRWAFNCWSYSQIGEKANQHQFKAAQLHLFP